MTGLAFEDKATADFQKRCAIQEARDAMSCTTCGHKNVSHGYGYDDTESWPDASRIGMGPCGMDGCYCERFTFD